MALWDNDLLGRKGDAKVLTSYLTQGRAKERSFVLNIDASWGQGKTYFLTNWAAELREQGFSVASVDAWANDYADDPLLAVVAAVDKALPSKGKAVAHGLAVTGAHFVGLMAKHGAKALLTRTLGEEGKEAVALVGEVLAKEGAAGVAEATEKLADSLGAKLLKRFEDGQKTINDFKKQLTKAVAKAGNNGPLIVLVDELDRCRPTFAVEMLERIKHLFDVPNVVFVVATDTEQLIHAIGSIYGTDFDGRGYLRRFFNRTYRFPEPERTAFIRYQFDSLGIKAERLSAPPANDHISFFAQVATGMGISLRDIERCTDMLATAVELWDKPTKLEPLLLLPLIISEMRNDHARSRQLSLGTLVKEDWDRFVSGTSDFTFKYWSENVSKEQKISWVKLLEDFLKRGQETLPDINKSQISGGADEWIVERFDEEFSHIYQNRGSYEGPKSVIWKYPELVRMVGRFSEETTSDRRP